MLASVSRRYPEPKGRFPRVTHPCATKAEAFVRLACVRHAASVRSEPGSNSQVQAGPRSEDRIHLTGPLNATSTQAFETVRLLLLDRDAQATRDASPSPEPVRGQRSKPPPAHPFSQHGINDFQDPAAPGEPQCPKPNPFKERAARAKTEEPEIRRRNKQRRVLGAALGSSSAFLIRRRHVCLRRCVGGAVYKRIPPAGASAFCISMKNSSQSDLSPKSKLDSVYVRPSPDPTQRHGEAYGLGERLQWAQPIDAATPIGLTVTKMVRMVADRKWQLLGRTNSPPPQRSETCEEA